MRQTPQKNTRRRHRATRAPRCEFNPSRTPHPASPASDERIVRPQPERMPARPHAQKFTRLPKNKTSTQAARECGPHACAGILGSPNQLMRELQGHLEHPARRSCPVERAPPAMSPALCARATPQPEVAARPPPSHCVAARTHCPHPCAPADLPAICQRDDLQRRSDRGD